MTIRTRDAFGCFDRATGQLQGLVQPVAAEPMLPLPTAAEVAGLRMMVSGDFSAATYDGGGNLTSYTRGGIVHTVDWSTPTAPVISNTSGAPARTVTLDGSGRVTAIV